MEDIVVRPRYPRHGITVKKRKKGGRPDVNLAEKMTRQVLASILILLLFFMIKSIDAPLTNSLRENIRLVTEWDINLETISNAFGGMFSWIRAKDPAGSDKTDLDNNSNSNMDSNADPSTGSTQNLNTDINTSNQSVSDNMLIPVDGVLVSRYGKSTALPTQITGFHNGIDIEVPGGTSVKAAQSGKVTETGSSRYYGNYVKVSHAGGLITLYAHCSKITVKDGQEIAKGDTIAEIGDIAASAGSHLHFEVWKNGQTMDPLDFINIISE